MAVTWSSRSVSGGEFGGGSHHGIADGVPGHTQYVSDPGEAEAVNNDHLHRQRYCVFPLPGLLPGGCCGARPENKRHSGNAAPLLEVWWVSTYGGACINLRNTASWRVPGWVQPGHVPGSVVGRQWNTV